MGNRALNQGDGPCRACVHFRGTAVHLSEYVVCASPDRPPEFYGDARTGCRFFMREPGSDDDAETEKSLEA